MNGKRSKVLITGSSGFIGVTLTEKLHDSYELIGLDRLPPKERWPAVHYRIADVTDREALVRAILEAEPDYVVHLAARARVQDGVSDPVGTYRTNVEGTINVLEACSRLPSLRKVVVISSEAVYGVVEKYPTPEELGPGKPTSVYAASKAAADLLAQQFRGAKVIVARSAMGCGPRSNPAEQIVSKFVQNAMLDKPLVFPGLKDPPGHATFPTPPAPVVHPTRDISPVWNFAEGIRLILETPEASGVYNIGSGKEISILELAKTVIRVLGKGTIWYDQNFQYRESEEGYRTALDITKARKDLGFEPKVTLEEAITLTASWMREYPNYWGQRRVPWHRAWSAYAGSEE